MKKILLFICFSLFLSSVQGQNYYIAYLYKYVFGSTVGTKRYITIQEDTLSYGKVEKLTTNAIVLDSGPSGKRVSFFVKNYNSNFLYYTTGIPFSTSTYKIKDSLHPMKWEKLKETKNISNYKCKAAKTTFRGRTYIAYYTEKIPISTGPWKFGGLPGLILEVRCKDEDGELIWEIENITKNPKDLKGYKEDYSKHEFITWQQFSEIYQDIMTKKLAKLKADVASSPGDSGRIKTNSIEIIDKRSDTGKGLEY